VAQGADAWGEGDLLTGKAVGGLAVVVDVHDPEGKKAAGECKQWIEKKRDWNGNPP
jgi:hypothetical protein